MVDHRLQRLQKDDSYAKWFNGSQSFMASGFIIVCEFMFDAFRKDCCRSFRAGGMVTENGYYACQILSI
ncbi:MAG TPA: hypothetical protein VK136_07305 [Bacillota bacterium]|nr:hypothetical protein [Bacillota bacterium]